MADKVASLYGELNLEDNMTPALKKAQGNLSSFSTGLKSAGKSVSDFGAGMVKISAPFIAGMGAAIKAAVDFDEQITNVASVMGLSAQESDAMGQSMLALSETTKFSATELAGAMYDVVGGVADASKHMDILAGAAALAEANNSALDGSTNALIATMNAYRDANVSAAQTSDVLTMTVKQGVGTMDELAAKFGTTATLAAPLGIDIAELGMLFAELSKNGATFSESGTRIEAALSSLINPTVELEDAFKKMGMTQADVIKMLDEQGLTAVIQKMTDAGVDLTQVFGNKEALLGVLAIANIDPTALEDFTTGMEGATAAAQAIQAEGAKFKWDTIVGDFNDMAVVVGQALLPAFVGIVEQLSPLVTGFANWAKENPALIQQIALLAVGAAAVGLVMIPLGTAISGLGTVAAVAAGAMGLLAGVAGILITPVTLLFTALGGLVLLFTGEGGLIGGVTRAFTALGQLGLIIGVTLMQAIQDFVNTPFMVELHRIFEETFNAIGTLVNDFIGVFEGIGAVIQVLADSPVFGGIINAFSGAFDQIKGIVEGVVNSITGFLNGVKTSIEDVLISLGLMESRSNATTQAVGNMITNLSSQIGAFTQSAFDGMVNQGLINAPTQLPGKAEGGPVSAGMPITVGERGKEWFVPSVNGTIVNQRQARGMGGLSIGTLVLQGINDPQQLFDKLRQIEGQRGL